MLTRQVGQVADSFKAARFAAVAAVAAALVASGLLALSAPAADAARRPTRPEAKAIKRIALRTCGHPAGRPCRFHRARVSTRDGRFAWGNVTGEGFSGVLLKRRTPHGTRFRVVGTQGGGIGSCDYWRARAPRPVLRDLRVVGLTDVSAGTTGSCG